MLATLHEIPVPQGRTGARNFLARCCKDIGLGFHPDTPFEDYITSDGTRLFTDKEARKLDRCMAASKAIYNAMGKDIYQFCMEQEPFLSFSTE